MSFEAQLKTTYSEAHKRLLNPPPISNPVPVTFKTPDKDHPQQRKFFQLSTTILPRCPKLHQILQMVSQGESVEINVILGRRQQKPIVLARQLFFFFSYYYTRCSLHQIGTMVGGRDHSTVLHGVRMMERRFNESELWQRKFVIYLSQLKAMVPSPVIPTIPDDVSFA